MKVAILLAAGILAAAAPDDGWTPLFDGATTSEWRGMVGTPFPDEYWGVRDGCLVTKPALIGRDIISRDEFDNFEFTFEWRISPGGNSGVKYLIDEYQEYPYEYEIWVGLFVLYAVIFVSLVLLRVFLWSQHRIRFGFSPRVLAGILVVFGALAGWAVAEVLHRIEHWATGLEMQLLDDESHRDGETPSRSAGSLYDLIAPESSPANPAGEWNTGRIKIDGNHVEHWINGVRVVSYDIGSEDLRRRISESKFGGLHGFGTKGGKRIVLQHHQDEVWFRALRVRRLPG